MFRFGIYQGFNRFDSFWMLVVLSMFMMLISASKGLGNHVHGVELYQGRGDEAHDQDYNEKTLYIAPGESVGFCGTVDHTCYADDEDELTWKWDFGDGTTPVEYALSR